MSFPRSLFTCVLNNLIRNRHYVKQSFIYTLPINDNKKKYILKKVVRLSKKIMEPISDSNLLSPPESIRGLKILDKSVIKKQIKVPVVILGDVVVSQVLPHLRKYLLKMENLAPVQTYSEIQFDSDEKHENVNKQCKCVLLNPVYVEKWLDLSETNRVSLSESGISSDHFKIANITLGYDNWRADELLRFILPEDQHSVAGFSKIGHLIHLNLREHVFEYKNIVGQILLDKIHGCRTVINKLDKIDSTYRNFEMEILGGDTDTLVKVKENHSIFEFDFSTVYWNPRLSTEHERIVNILKAGDILYDVFAGVGPFSIPAAKKKCSVFANDLNPESYKWLNHNAKINKIKSEHLWTFNKDGRDFIRNDLKTDLKKRLHNLEVNRIYITMNLPALAPEFLPVFVGLFSDSDLENLEIRNYPKVVVYCFAKGEKPIDIARDLVERNLGFSLPENYEIFNVRKVSSNKEMMRVSFDLNRDILIGNLCKKRGAEDLSTDTKKCV